jgi:hypothetical protein
MRAASDVGGSGSDGGGSDGDGGGCGGDAQARGRKRRRRSGVADGGRGRLSSRTNGTDGMKPADCCSILREEDSLSLAGHRLCGARSAVSPRAIKLFLTVCEKPCWLAANCRPARYSRLEQSMHVSRWCGAACGLGSPVQLVCGVKKATGGGTVAREFASHRSQRTHAMHVHACNLHAQARRIRFWVSCFDFLAWANDSIVYRRLTFPVSVLPAACRPCRLKKNKDTHSTRVGCIPGPVTIL